MKKGTCFLLVYAILMTILVVAPFTANANEKEIVSTSGEGTSGISGNCTWTLDNGVLTISGSGNMMNYDIHYSYLNGEFYSIAPWGIYNINSVIINNGVTSIGDFAFAYCKNLTSVDIPDSVTSIGYGAFSDTAWYNNQSDGLVYAGKVAYKMKGLCPAEVRIKEGTLGIAAEAFHGCSTLTSIDLPASLTTICNNAFCYCSLTSIDIPDSVTSIGGSAFSGCESLTTVKIGYSVTTIGWSAFSGCTSLTSISIPDSVTSIGGSAFERCEYLKTAYINQATVDNFKNVFDSGYVEIIILNDSVTSIGSNTFSGCSNLTSVDIPDSVKSIGASAFYGTAMNSVTIPATVTDIYDKAFGYYNKVGFGESKVKDFTIYGYKNSEAQRYADDNNFTFVALDDEPFDPTKTTDREIFGDIDGDGDITIVDTTFLQRYTVELATPYPIGEKING